MFRDGASIRHDALEDLFLKYQNRMEAALEDFAAEEGLRDASEIIDALRQTRDERDEWKKLDKMIDTMTKKELFFVMMQKKAQRTFNGKAEPPHPDSLAGGKSGDGGGGGGDAGASKSNRK